MSVSIKIEKKTLSFDLVSEAGEFNYNPAGYNGLFEAISTPSKESKLFYVSYDSSPISGESYIRAISATDLVSKIKSICNSDANPFYDGESVEISIFPVSS